MSRTVATLLYLALSIIVPLLLYVVYVSAMRGRSSSSAILHYGCMFGAVGCALPFVAMLRTSVVVRVVVAIVIVPVVFLITQVGGAFFACVLFGSCP